MTTDTFTIELIGQRDYRFEVHFDDPTLPVLLTDEPAPLGGGAGPNPARLLVAAVANCLAASLQYALRKFGNDPGTLHARATLTMTRNRERRLRIGRIAVDLQLGVATSELRMLDRALTQFEHFCVVTQSVRAAFPVDVRVTDRIGTVLKAPHDSTAELPAVVE